MTWHRADEGDLPVRGQVISMVDYPESGGVKVWGRLRVEVVLTSPRPSIYGASLPFNHGDSVDLPGRPENHFGRALFWKEAE